MTWTAGAVYVSQIKYLSDNGSGGRGRSHLRASHKPMFYIAYQSVHPAAVPQSGGALLEKKYTDIKSI
jgi:hypothetical protein